MLRATWLCGSWILLVLLVGAVHCSAKDARSKAVEAPEVTIAQGVVKGLEATSFRGRTFYAYKGIRYAQPPVGKLRFQAPEPLPPGSSVIDGTLDGPPCIQKTYFDVQHVVVGQEDCLTINVYTPKVSNDLLPVMVWIHGGAFFGGSGSSYLYGPDYLLDKDIVMVAFNYRLGALGLLSTGDESAPGNYAMKDQVAALKWVRDNIAAFGGNPDSVTLFGQSSGGASVHYHMLSDQSTGLYHRVISESGTALGVWSWSPLNPYTIAQKQAAYFNCPTNDSQQLIDCLLTVDAYNLTDSGDIFHFFSIDPLTTYTPVVEDPLNAGSFLTGHPLDLLLAGKFNQVPWMTGVVAQEGIIRGQSIVSDPVLLNELNANWSTLAPRLCEMQKSIEDADVAEEVWKNVTAFYFENGLPITPDNALNFINLYSDRSFMQGAHKSVLLQARQGHDNIYMYNFNYRGSNSFSTYFSSDPTNYGVCHSDETIYLLKQANMFPEWSANHADRKVVDSLVTLWTNFATYGTPTPPGGIASSHVSCDVTSTDSDNRCDLSQLAWTPVPTVPPPGQTDLRTTYLNIYLNDSTGKQTLDFSMEKEFYKERMAFWDSLKIKENLI